MSESAVLLAIGEVAKDTGVAVSAVRYYDEIGLIVAAARVGGKRRFDRDTVGRVSFIKQAQESGLSLDEIRIILDETRSDWQSIIEAKLAELAERRARLDVMIGLLTEYRDCGCDTIAACPRALLS